MTATTESGRLVLSGGEVFDGVSSSPYRADLAIEEEQIVGLGLGLDGDRELRVDGCTIVPGLFDCHVHVCVSSVDVLEMLAQPFSLQFFNAAQNLRQTLDAGITTVRDAGGADLGVKEAVDRGLVSGPDLQISITALGQTGGHTDNWYPCGVSVPAELMQHPGRPDGIVDGAEAVRRKVREVIRAGADVIKVCTSGGVLSPRDDPRHAHFSPAELEVMVEEAARVGRWVMAHAMGAEGIKSAVRAGIRSVEHGVYLDEEAVALMAERDCWLVPTLVAPLHVVELGRAGANLPPPSLEKALEAVESHRRSFRLALEGGVRIAMGTDSGVVAHGLNLRELALMAEYGMEPAAVLRAATSSAAELLGLEGRKGRLAEGALADLVVVDGSPFDFRSLPGTISKVFKHGHLVRERGTLQPEPAHGTHGGGA